MGEKTTEESEKPVSSVTGKQYGALVFDEGVTTPCEYCDSSSSVVTSSKETQNETDELTSNDDGIDETSTLSEKTSLQTEEEEEVKEATTVIKDVKETNDADESNFSSEGTSVQTKNEEFGEQEETTSQMHQETNIQETGDFAETNYEEVSQQVPSKQETIIQEETNSNTESEENNQETTINTASEESSSLEEPTDNLNESQENISSSQEERILTTGEGIEESSENTKPEESKSSQNSDQGTYLTPTGSEETNIQETGDFAETNYKEVSQQSPTDSEKTNQETIIQEETTTSSESEENNEETTINTVIEESSSFEETTDNLNESQENISSSQEGEGIEKSSENTKPEESKSSQNNDQGTYLTYTGNEEIDQNTTVYKTSDELNSSEEITENLSESTEKGGGIRETSENTITEESNSLKDRSQKTDLTEFDEISTAADESNEIIASDISSEPISSKNGDKEANATTKLHNNVEDVDLTSETQKSDISKETHVDYINDEFSETESSLESEEVSIPSTETPETNENISEITSETLESSESNISSETNYLHMQSEDLNKDENKTPSSSVNQSFESETTVRDQEYTEPNSQSEINENANEYTEIGEINSQSLPSNETYDSSHVNIETSSENNKEQLKSTGKVTSDEIASVEVISEELKGLSTSHEENETNNLKTMKNSQINTQKVELSTTTEIENVPFEFGKTTACEYCHSGKNQSSSDLATKISETAKLSQTETIYETTEKIEKQISIESSKSSETSIHQEKYFSYTTKKKVESLSTIQIDKALAEFETTPCEYCNSREFESSSHVHSVESSRPTYQNFNISSTLSITLESKSSLKTKSVEEKEPEEKVEEETSKSVKRTTSERKELTLKTGNENTGSATTERSRSEKDESTNTEQANKEEIEHKDEGKSEISKKEKSVSKHTEEMLKSVKHTTTEGKELTSKTEKYDYEQTEKNKTELLSTTQETKSFSELKHTEKHRHTTLEDKEEVEKEEETEKEIEKHTHLFNYTHGHVISTLTESYQKVPQKPVVIIINNSKGKHKKLDKIFLEDVISTPIVNVELHYIDLNSEAGDNLELNSINKSLNIDAPYKACTRTDFENGNNCFCNMQTYLDTLISRIVSDKIIRSKDSYCDSFLRLKSGLLIRNSIKPTKRKRRGLIYMQNLDKKGHTLQYESVESLFETDFNMQATDSSMFYLPSETVRIPCENYSEGNIEEEKQLTWMFYPLSTSKGEVLPEKGKELVLYGTSMKNAGNYTCSPGSQNDSSSKQYWHELEMITFPLYHINMNIFYKINVSCSLKMGDALQTYLPKIFSPILCSNENEVCSVELERPRCLTREDDNYFNVTVKVKMNSDFVLPLRTKCDTNCKLRVYENVVNMVYKNSDIIEHITVYSQLEQLPDINFIPHLTGRENSQVNVKPPKIVVSCSAGFGLESKVQRVCVICPPQTFSGNDEAFCKTCPGGKYQPEPGSSACLQCNSPVDDKMCLRMLYTDTKLFKIYVGVAFGFIVLMVIMIIVWTSGFKDHSQLGNRYYEGSLRHRASIKRKDMDIEVGANEPLIRHSPKGIPPQLPPVDF